MISGVANFAFAFDFFFGAFVDGIWALALPSFGLFAMLLLYKYPALSTIGLLSTQFKGPALRRGADLMSAGKRVLGGFVASLAWLVLSLALAITAANMIVNSLNHVGESAAGIMKQVSADPATLNSLVDEFAKSADPKLAQEIKKNREQIEVTITSLASSQDFRELVTTTLDQISQATISGAPSVAVDFSKIAALIASKVNAAANESVIKQKDLDSIKPTVVDLSKQSKNITDIKDKLRQGLLIWLVWFLLIAVSFLLRGPPVLRTAGLQLASVGLIGLVAKLAAPTLLVQYLPKANMATYQRNVIPEVVSALTSPILTLSIALLVAGLVAITTAIFLSRKKRELAN